ncbi:MAG: phosphoglycerate kinase [Candidatus Omnitrophica bacterium]|nr:phosphoglycerate kinase [Candidatus Omnitrophota bacterium]
MNKKSVTDINLEGKTVLMRVDFNVPLDEHQKITDDSRIKAALETINYCLSKQAKLVLMSHLGRPKGQKKPEYSLKPVAERLSELLAKPVEMLSDCIGEDVKAKVKSLAVGEVVLLENLRFYEQETLNDPDFAKQLASLGDVFVNDAFGTCHRAHASTEGVTHYLESVSGFLVQKEIEYFQKVLTQAEKPFLFILGGAKVADKIPVIENMLERADCIIIGGAMAYTFMKVKGVEIGSSRVELDSIPIVEKILAKAKESKVELVLPLDHVITDNIKESLNVKVTADQTIAEGWIGVDIGPKTIKLFCDKIAQSKTVVWNGPAGIFENEKFAQGTKELALAVAKATAESQVTSVIGGGDTAAAVAKFNLSDKMSHISTGGGASLEYLEGKVLPGIAALSDK